MSAKRSATEDLNHDNWDRDDEPEEMGTFQRASQIALKNRVFKTAKRRNPISGESGDGAKKSAFASFSGFTNQPATTDFSFLKNISQSDSTKTETPKTNGLDKHAPSNNIFACNPTPNNKSSTSIFGASTVVNDTGTKTNNIFGHSNKPDNAKSGARSDAYFSKLKGLNESVLKWITQKVEENPMISLMPVFKDYEKYLEDIEKLEKIDSTKQTTTPSFSYMAVSDSTSEKPIEKKTNDQQIPQFKFGPPTSNPTNTIAVTPSFGLANSTTTSLLGKTAATNSTIPTFSFGNTSSSSSLTGSSGFSFGTMGNSGNLAPNSLATNSAPQKSNNQDDNGGGGGEEDEDQPPKVDFTPVIEKDHLYTTRCKVFVKKDKEEGFADRGVGNLFLKSVEGSEKVQLIVRADTNLGNLLSNFILSESIPTKRMGKKDVMLVTMPLPDSKPPPVPILFRVKSPEEADKLLAILEKYKK